MDHSSLVPRVGQSNAFDLSVRWQLAAGVTMNDDGFGAMSYRKGAFDFMPLRCSRLADVLDLMDAGETAKSALQTVGIPRPQWNNYVRALESMRGAGLLVRSHDASTTVTQRAVDD